METWKLSPTAFCTSPMKWVKNSTSLLQLAKNRLFSQYHAQYPEHERKRIVDELVNGTSNHRVLFVTVSCGICIDCNNIHRRTNVKKLDGQAEISLCSRREERALGREGEGVLAAKPPHSTCFTSRFWT